VIWGKREAEYFCKRDWTGQITLIRFNKSGFFEKLRSVTELVQFTCTAATGAPTVADAAHRRSSSRTTAQAAYALPQGGGEKREAQPGLSEIFGKA
jgi:hypothetical protein